MGIAFIEYHGRVRRCHGVTLQRHVHIMHLPSRECHAPVPSWPSQSQNTSCWAHALSRWPQIQHTVEWLNQQLRTWRTGDGELHGGQFVMHSLGCYFEPRGGSLLMLDTTRVAHGTMPHHGTHNRRRIGVALQVKVSASACMQLAHSSATHNALYTMCVDNDVIYYDGPQH